MANVSLNVSMKSDLSRLLFYRFCVDCRHSGKFRGCNHPEGMLSSHSAIAAPSAIIVLYLFVLNPCWIIQRIHSARIRFRFAHSVHGHAANSKPTDMLEHNRTHNICIKRMLNKQPRTSSTKTNAKLASSASYDYIYKSTFYIDDDKTE